MHKKLNRPDMAARRRLTVAGAKPTARPVSSEMTLSCWPGNCAERQSAKYLNKVSVTTAANATPSSLNQRAKCKRSKAYERTVAGE